MELKKGDFVYVGDKSGEEIQELVDVFVMHGARDYDKGRFKQHLYPYLVWDAANDVWCCGEGIKCHRLRQLTIAQVLGEDEPGVPEVGSLWVSPDNDEKPLTVVGYHDGCVICWDGDVSYEPYDPSELTVPAKSERDKAVEEMLEEMHDVVMYTTPRGYITPATAKLLYDAGYRKVEEL